MPSRTLTTRSIRRTAMASVLAGLAFASTAHAGTTGTDADDTLYVNPFGNKTARDTVALTVTKAF